ncbi:hypothetical protein Gotri_026307 [Gossypium trilobum]|uniref:Aminotransferase-like plant mobile domain-containing protein n=1 Tax=Gossypium trilobum TaxID=34281 RepID=A0A7J9FLF8_9ROSI|nr:hypothetical protein [Gossypium trilobum]
MHPLEKFAEFDLGTSGYEVKCRHFFLEYLRVGHLPQSTGHIDDAISDLFNRLDKRVTPIPTISVETFRSLSACRRVGEGRFIGCAQLLLAWLKEFVAIPR